MSEMTPERASAAFEHMVLRDHPYSPECCSPCGWAEPAFRWVRRLTPIADDMREYLWNRAEIPRRDSKVYVALEGEECPRT